MGAHHGKWAKAKPCIYGRAAAPCLAPSPSINWLEEELDFVADQWKQHGSPQIPSTSDADACLYAAAGLITLADWIASDENHFSANPNLAPSTKEQITQKAQAVVTDLGLGPLNVRAGLTFEDIFGNHPYPMAHTFWRGENLSQTLHLNMCARNDIEKRLSSISGAVWGKPVWEDMPKSMDDENAWHNATHSYLGRLTPLSRLVLLQQDASAMVLGAGPVLPNFNNAKARFIEEPTSTIILRGKDKKQEQAILAVSPGKALWRELHALVAHRNKHNVGGFWASPLALAVGKASRDMVVAGMVRDQAEVVDTLESVYHIPEALQHEAGQQIYEQGVQCAETMARKLGWAVDTFRETVDGGWKGRLKGAGAGKGDLLTKLRQKALTQYWTAAEQNLPLLLASVESLGSDAHDAAQKAWKKALFVAAHQAYAVACAPQTPRQHRAFALGLARLSKPAAETDSSGMPSETSSDTSHEEDDV